MALVYGGAAGVRAGVFALCTGAPVLAVAHLIVRHPSRFGPLSRQLAISVAMASGVGVAEIAAVPFVSTPDPFTLALLLVFMVTLAGYSAWLVASRVSGDITAVRDAVVAAGEGARFERLAVRSEDEVAELAAAANRLFRELERSESEHRRLLVAVAHDLRAPLSCLQLLVEATTDGMLEGASQRSVIDRMSFHIRSLGSLIDDLFDLARIEAGDVAWSVEPAPVDTFIEEIVRGMRPRAEASGVCVWSALPETIPAALVNRPKVQRVLSNLIENAMQHTRPGGEVQVSARASATEVTIEVADTGVGIDPAEREHVFEPFFRRFQDRAPTHDGAGLGLPICRAIVHALGGRIWVEPSHDGARVRFTLPRAPGPAARAESSPERVRGFPRVADLA